MIKNCNDPQFVTPIEMTYQFEMVQKLKFEVYDVDDGKTASISQDFCLGVLECNLGEVRTSDPWTMSSTD